jgi:hypothetical protein
VLLFAVHMIVVAVFSVWWLLSVASQFRLPVVQRMKQRDVFHLIPNWRFFAPVPARRDYNLEYRFLDQHGRITRWTRAPLIGARTTLCLVWYPAKRIRKAFNTSVRRLTRRMSKDGRDAAAHSLAYLGMLNYLQHLEALAGTRALQFRILTSQDFAAHPRPRLVFTSDWHFCRRR